MILRLDQCPAEFPVDEVYARLVAMGANRDGEEARAMLSALTLVLVNHIGDASIIFDAIELVEATFNAKAPARGR